MELTAGKHKSGGRLRKLLSTREGTILVAGVCTLVAAGILLIAAARYRHSVDATARPETVFVASSLIQKGTPGDVVSGHGLFHTQRILAKQVTGGAIADATSIVGKVAVKDIQPGQQLTLGDFSTASGVTAQLAPDERAISVPLDTSHGLTGVVNAGDRVDVYAGVDGSVDRASNGISAGAALRLLMSNVPVLAVSKNAGSGLGGSGVNAQADVVLRVNASKAGALAFASDNGKVWLILRGANAKNPSAQAQAAYTINSLLLGSKTSNGGKP
jgi:Flp pilus assembly protein CpaB